MNDEGVTAILGLVLLQQPNAEVRVPMSEIQKGLPENSGVQVFQDEATDEVVIRVAKFSDDEEE